MDPYRNADKINLLADVLSVGALENPAQLLALLRERPWARWLGHLDVGYLATKEPYGSKSVSCVNLAPYCAAFERLYNSCRYVVITNDDFCYPPNWKEMDFTFETNPSPLLYPAPIDGPGMLVIKGADKPGDGKFFHAAEGKSGEVIQALSEIFEFLKPFHLYGPLPPNPAEKAVTQENATLQAA